jgi:uncharacterized protein YjbJ (UPF0337 family)
MANDHETDHLRHGIAETRDRMSETLDELSVRLNPNRIKEHVRENIREATVGRVENMARHAQERAIETREGILDTIRDNPIPAAMIGVGLGWMLFNGRRNGHGLSESHGSWSHTHQSNETGEQYNAGYYGDVSATTPRLMQDDAAGGIGASISHQDEPGVVDRLRSKVSDTVSNVGDTASGFVGQAGGAISDVAGRTQERVGDVAHRVTHVASDVVETTRYQAMRVEDRLSRTMRENPLALGAVALAVGMAAGFAIPETRRENQLMGGARDQLMDRAREMVDDTREKVQNVAERVVDETLTEP